jgi:hypothetical protein
LGITPEPNGILNTPRGTRSSNQTAEFGDIIFLPNAKRVMARMARALSRRPFLADGIRESALAKSLIPHRLCGNNGRGGGAEPQWGRGREPRGPGARRPVNGASIARDLRSDARDQPIHAETGRNPSLSVARASSQIHWQFRLPPMSHRQLGWQRGHFCLDRLESLTPLIQHLLGRPLPGNGESSQRHLPERSLSPCEPEGCAANQFMLQFPISLAAIAPVRASRQPTHRASHEHPILDDDLLLTLTPTSRGACLPSSPQAPTCS